MLTKFLVKVKLGSVRLRYINEVRVGLCAFKSNLNYFMSTVVFQDVNPCSFQMVTNVSGNRNTSNFRTEDGSSMFQPIRSHTAELLHGATTQVPTICYSQQNTSQVTFHCNKSTYIKLYSFVCSYS